MKLSIFVSLAFLAAAQADNLVPVSWKQSNSFNNARLASNLSNATGMSPDGTILYNQDGLPSGERNTADNAEWMTSAKSVNRAAAMAAGRVWVVADLGASYNLSSIRIWNFNWDNTPGTPASLNDRGISQFDVLVRNADADTTDGTVSGTPINLNNPADDATNALDNDAVFALGTTSPWTVAIQNQSLTQAPNDDTYTGQSFNLTGQTARFIAIRVDSHYGNTGGIGLGKVRIESASGVDLTPPTLASISPVDDATNVVTNSNLVANFNELILPGTGTLTIKRTDNDSVVESFDVASARLTWAATQVTIDPTDSLLPGVAYYVQIDATAIKDVSNNPYAGIVDPDKTSWSFTTDGTPPTFVSQSPVSPAKADPGTRLMVQFSEAVQVGTGTVSIRKTSDDSLAESFDVTAPGAVIVNGRVAAFIRGTALTPGVEYYVNLPAGAFQDASGNTAAAITGNTAWKFTINPAVPIVAENFNNSGTSLHGTSADVFAPEIVTAGGISNWSAGTGFLGNGMVSGSGNSAAYLNLGSYINDTKGKPEGKFDLTMTIGEATGSWVSLGYVTTAPALTQNFTTLGGLGTIIYRSQTGVASPSFNGELDMFGGPNNTNPVDGPDGKTGFRTLTVTLDLTPAGGYDGTANFGTVTWSDSALGTLGSYVFTASRSFGSILVTQGTTISSINGLALYQIKPTNTFASWIGGFNVGGATGAAQDPDGDGLGNALENLLGSNPEVFSPGLTAVSPIGGNQIAFRHTRSATPAADLTGAYQWSLDLLTWNASGANAGGTTVTFSAPVVVTPGTPEQVEVTATVSGSPAVRVFVRFKATQN